jgi:hypothetical protein
MVKIIKVINNYRKIKRHLPRQQQLLHLLSNHINLELRHQDIQLDLKPHLIYLPAEIVQK